MDIKEEEKPTPFFSLEIAGIIQKSAFRLNPETIRVLSSMKTRFTAKQFAQKMGYSWSSGKYWCSKLKLMGILRMDKKIDGYILNPEFNGSISIWVTKVLSIYVKAIEDGLIIYNKKKKIFENKKR